MHLLTPSVTGLEGQITLVAHGDKTRTESRVNFSDTPLTEESDRRHVLLNPS